VNVRRSFADVEDLDVTLELFELHVVHLHLPRARVTRRALALVAGADHELRRRDSTDLASHFARRDRRQIRARAASIEVIGSSRSTPSTASSTSASCSRVNLNVPLLQPAPRPVPRLRNARAPRACTLRAMPIHSSTSDLVATLATCRSLVQPDLPRLGGLGELGQLAHLLGDSDQLPCLPGLSPRRLFA